MELARDLETIIQSSVGPSRTADFLLQARSLDPPSQVSQLNAGILLALLALKDHGRLSQAALVGAMRLLDPARYAGLRFKSDAETDSQVGPQTVLQSEVSGRTALHGVASCVARRCMYSWTFQEVCEH